MSNDDAPARFRWLPPGLRPPVAMVWRQERIFLLVGVAALFAGYDMNVFGLAIPQIQASLHIPENQVGLTVSYFRLATIVALLIAASADLVGRRRLLLFTIFGQAVFTLVTAFSGDYAQFVWAQILTRVFGYAEEMLCFVVIAEEVAAGARGWANGTLSAMDYTGAGLASLVFALVNFLPYGWRAIYVIGAVPLFLVAYLRRNLPETRRFAAQENVADILHPHRRGAGAAARPGAAISGPHCHHPGRGGGVRLRHRAGQRAVLQISAGRVSLFAAGCDPGVYSRRTDRAGAGYHHGTHLRPDWPQADDLCHRHHARAAASRCFTAVCRAGGCRRYGSCHFLDSFPERP